MIKQLTQEVIGLQKLKKLFQRLFPSVSWFREHNKFLDSYPFLILFFAIIRLVTIPFASWRSGVVKNEKIQSSQSIAKNMIYNFWINSWVFFEKEGKMIYDALEIAEYIIPEIFIKPKFEAH